MTLAGKKHSVSQGKAARMETIPKRGLDPVKEATFRQHQANFFAGKNSPMHRHPHDCDTPSAVLLVTEHVRH